jgi:hypothetical protein
MRCGMAGVLAATMALSLGVSARATAPKTTWASYTDPTYGMRVSIPKSWNVVPPTVAGVQALVSRLDKKNQAGLAGVYSALIGSSEARAQLLRYHFQAFDYVPTATQQPDFALAFARTTKALASDVAAISASFAASYASEPGATVSKHTVVTLPAGRAAFIQGVERKPGQPPQQVQIYVLGRGTVIYELIFRADVGVPGAAATFKAIANRFVLT